MTMNALEIFAKRHNTTMERTERFNYLGIMFMEEWHGYLNGSTHPSSEGRSFSTAVNAGHWLDDAEETAEVMNQQASLMGFHHCNFKDGIPSIQTGESNTKGTIPFPFTSE